MNTNNMNKRQNIINMASGHTKKYQNLTTKNLLRATFNKEKSTNPLNFKNRNVRNNSEIFKFWNDGSTNQPLSTIHNYNNKIRVISFEVAFTITSRQTPDYSKILKKSMNPDGFDLYFTDDVVQFIYIELVYRWKLTRSNARELMNTFYTGLVNYILTQRVGSPALQRFLSTHYTGNINNIMKKYIFIPGKISLNFDNIRPYLKV